MQPSAWRYLGKADPERLAALTHSPPHADLAGALKRGLALRCFHREPREHDASYERAVFSGTVDHGLFDWFFNASTGYRGAFYAAPDVGVRANRALLDHLVEFLLDWALAQQPNRDRSWILASLSKPSAKAWLAEHPGLCPSCAGEWSSSYVSDLQIQNNRWENSSHVHAAWGRQVPRLTKIRIFGGFVDEHHGEWLAAHKSARATHISGHGWS